MEWPAQVEEAILEDIIGYISVLNTKIDLSHWELVPAYNSLTLINHKTAVDFDRFRSDLLAWYAQGYSVAKTKRYLWRLPVCYDLDFGIDMEEVSQNLGLEAKDIIDLHTSQKYTVYGIGFLPGFMYLGGLPKKLEIKRRESPRLKVAKGSVGLAALQTGIYPQESPGGWNIIGNCPVPMFNPNWDTPCFVSVGDQVQFYAIERAAYELYRIEGEVGIYKLKKTPIHA